jgi:hypothetical protein
MCQIKKTHVKWQEVIRDRIIRAKKTPPSTYSGPTNPEDGSCSYS